MVDGGSLRMRSGRGRGAAQIAIQEIVRSVREIAGMERAAIFFGDDEEPVLVADEPVNYRDTVEFRLKGYAQLRHPTPVIIRILGETQPDSTHIYTLELTNARERRLPPGAFQTELFRVGGEHLETLLAQHRFLYEHQSAEMLVEVNEFLMNLTASKRYTWEDFVGPRSGSKSR